MRCLLESVFFNRKIGDYLLLFLLFLRALGPLTVFVLPCALRPFTFFSCGFLLLVPYAFSSDASSSVAEDPDANPTSNKTFGFVVILRESTPPTWPSES